MAIKPTKYIWKNGKHIPFNDATIHILSHVVHYGTSWFEGIRAYKTRRGTAVFRLDDHMERLHNSLKIYRTVLPYDVETLSLAAIETIQKNELNSCYIRPIVIRGFGDMGVYALNCPLEVYITVWEWGAYLGDSSHQAGVDVCVSSWDRITPNSLPSLAKAGANYMNSQLVKMEAVENNYAEGICLDTYGNVSEGSGENVFIVIDDNTILTPPGASSILPGLTRDCVKLIARDLGINIIEQNIPRAMLYTASEMFFTGTAVEITPVRSVDRIPVGDGTVGPVTQAIQKRFQDVIKNGNDPYGWLTWVDTSVAVRAGRKSGKTKRSRVKE